MAGLLKWLSLQDKVNVFLEPFQGGGRWLIQPRSYEGSPQEEALGERRRSGA
jgi:hypothetical protein